MEQLVARRAHNPKVVGSSPAPATWIKASSRKIWGFAIYIRLTWISQVTHWLIYLFRKLTFYQIINEKS